MNVSFTVSYARKLCCDYEYLQRLEATSSCLCADGQIVFSASNTGN